MKNLFLIPLILFVYSSIYGSRNNLSRELSILPHCDIGKTTAFPSIYQNDLSHKIYFLFSTNLKKEIRQLSGVMIQFYKKFVYNEHLPKDILFQIFDYLTPSLSTFFFLNLGHIKEKVDLYPIRQRDIDAVLSSQVLSFDTLLLTEAFLNVVNPFSDKDTEKFFIASNNDPILESDIELLKKAGLISLDPLDHRKYRPCMSFNNQGDYTHSHNKIANFKKKNKFYYTSFCSICHTSRKPIAGNNTVTIFDRDNDNNVKEVFAFKDYVGGSFCSAEYLFVELIDEVLECLRFGAQRKHCATSPPPTNHRIEIYDLSTKEKLSVVSLPLVKPYQFNTFLYSLAYVDCDFIYLYDHKAKGYVALPYKTMSIKDFMFQSEDFFASQLVQKSDIQKQSPALSNKTLLNTVAQKNNCKHSLQCIILIMAFALLINPCLNILSLQ